MILGLATLMGGMMVSSVRADEPVEARTIYHPGGGSTSAFEDEYGKGRPIGRDTATNEVHRGVTLGFYAPAGYYGSQEARDEVDRIAAAGASWVVLAPNVWQEGRYTTVQFNDFMKSQSDLDILDLCDYIHAKGLQVMLRPALECFDGTDRTYVDFDNDVYRLNPRQGSSGNTYCSRWFASMKARTVHFAAVAERCRCEAFCLDTTRDRMSGAAFNAHWTDILKDVRLAYRGLVTCGNEPPRKAVDFTQDRQLPDFWQNGLDCLDIEELPPASVRPEWLAPDGTAQVQTNGVFVDVAHTDASRQLADLRRRGLVQTKETPAVSAADFRPARVTPPIGKETALSSVHRGMSIGLRVPFGYFSSPEAKRDIDAMAEMGVDWVVLCVTVWQEGRYSPLQFADFGRTPGEIEILDICDYIHSKGMHVTLRPMEEAYDGTDRMYIDFENDVFRCPPISGSAGNTYCSRWFRTVKARSVWYARVAERCRCEAFCIDSEMDRMADYAFNAQWKDILAEVRKVYTGALTSCHTRNPRHGVKWNACLPHKDFWLYDLDYLQISDYRRPVGDYEERAHSLEEMQKGFETEWLPYFRNLAKRYGKPIQFGEFGCTSSKAGARSPATDSHLGYDGAEQANFLEAFMRVFSKEDWCRGYYWWNWTQSFSEAERLRREKDGPNTGFGPYGKPVADVFRKWYGGRGTKK